MMNLDDALKLATLLLNTLVIPTLFVLVRIKEDIATLKERSTSFHDRIDLLERRKTTR